MSGKMAFWKMIKNAKDSWDKFVLKVPRIASNARRLRDVDILNTDCLNVLNNHAEDPNTVVYLDPPCVRANQNQYGSYFQKGFDALLQLLAKARMIQLAQEHG